jgi:hypothetical protein
VSVEALETGLNAQCFICMCAFACNIVKLSGMELIFKTICTRLYIKQLMIYTFVH